MESQRYVLRERIQRVLPWRGMSSRRIYEEVDTETGKVLVYGTRRRSVKAWVDRDNTTAAQKDGP